MKTTSRRRSDISADSSSSKKDSKEARGLILSTRRNEGGSGRGLMSENRSEAKRRADSEDLWSPLKCDPLPFHSLVHTVSRTEQVVRG